MVAKIQIGECPQNTILNYKEVLNAQKRTYYNNAEISQKNFHHSKSISHFSGYVRQNSIEIIKWKPQIVTDDNASRGYLDIDFLLLITDVT